MLEAYSVSHGKASPYLPVIEVLKSYFRIEPHDDERSRREKIGGKVLMLDRSLEDTLPYLCALFGIEEQPDHGKECHCEGRSEAFPWVPLTAPAGELQLPFRTP